MIVFIIILEELSSPKLQCEKVLYSHHQQGAVDAHTYCPGRTQVGGEASRSVAPGLLIVDPQRHTSRGSALTALVLDAVDSGVHLFS